MIICTKNNILQKTKVYDTYWKFACERQNIFFRKLEGKKENLTHDNILKKYKFTNVYRASDRVSQYLIRNIIYQKGFTEEDIIFRILLFKIFNKIETWKNLENKIGRISYKGFRIELYQNILNELFNKREKIYSGAYIMPSGKSTFGFERKFKNHLRLIEYMMKDGLTKKILNSNKLKDAYNILLEYPTIGTFLAYQYAIDINYSEITDFDEMEFVVAGPGAKAGIRKCFSNSAEYSYEYIIHYVCEHQKDEFKRLNLNFKTLWGRELKLIDCQNIFCETDKYSRIRYPDIVDSNGRTKIKQTYFKNNKNIEYFYPPKWGINNKIKEFYENR
ncbi:hypothetical protein KQI13_03625 [Anaerostipes hadrus]|nr:hypothetical protein [Anaerostipes hadrus]